jgi:hypothetical protein
MEFALVGKDPLEEDIILKLNVLKTVGHEINPAREVKLIVFGKT